MRIPDRLRECLKGVVIPNRMSNSELHLVPAQPSEYSIAYNLSARFSVPMAEAKKALDEAGGHGGRAAKILYQQTSVSAAAEPATDNMVSGKLHLETRESPAYAESLLSHTESLLSARGTSLRVKGTPPPTPPPPPSEIPSRNLPLIRGAAVATFTSRSTAWPASLARTTSNGRSRSRH